MSLATGLRHLSVLLGLLLVTGTVQASEQPALLDEEISVGAQLESLRERIPPLPRIEPFGELDWSDELRTVLDKLRGIETLARIELRLVRSEREGDEEVIASEWTGAPGEFDRVVLPLLAERRDALCEVPAASFPIAPVGCLRWAIVAAPVQLSNMPFLLRIELTGHAALLLERVDVPVLRIRDEAHPVAPTFVSRVLLQLDPAWAESAPPADLLEGTRRIRSAFLEKYGGFGLSQHLTPERVTLKTGDPEGHAIVLATGRSGVELRFENPKAAPTLDARLSAPAPGSVATRAVAPVQGASGLAEFDARTASLVKLKLSRGTGSTDLSQEVDLWLQNTHRNEWAAAQGRPLTLQDLRRQAKQELEQSIASVDPSREFVVHGEAVLGSYDEKRQLYRVDGLLERGGLLGVRGELGHVTIGLRNHEAFQGFSLSPDDARAMESSVPAGTRELRVPVAVRFRLEGWDGKRGALVGHLTSVELYRDAYYSELAARQELAAPAPVAEAKPEGHEANRKNLLLATARLLDRQKPLDYEEAAAAWLEVAHPEEWHEVNRSQNEFARDALLDSGARELEAAVEAFDLEQDFLVPIELTLADYDPGAGSFPITLPERTPSVSIRNREAFQFLPMDRTAAQQLVEGLEHGRQLYGMAHIRIDEIARRQSVDRTRLWAPLSGTARSVRFYGDAERTHFLASVAPGAFSPENRFDERSQFLAAAKLLSQRRPLEYSALVEDWLDATENGRWYRANEFEKEELERELPARIQAEVESYRLDQEFVADAVPRLKAYDRASGRFPFDGGVSFSASLDTREQVHAVTFRNLAQLDGLRLDATAAERLVATRKPGRQVYARVYFRVDRLQDVARRNQSFRDDWNQAKMLLSAVVTRYEVYEDPERRALLERRELKGGSTAVAASQLPSVGARAEPAAPRAAPSKAQAEKTTSTQTRAKVPAPLSSRTEASRLLASGRPCEAVSLLEKCANDDRRCGDMLKLARESCGR